MLLFENCRVIDLIMDYFYIVVAFMAEYALKSFINCKYNLLW